ncbi:MAG: NTP transferase domain-containing protein, partial [Clostridiales bacterium]|nr:NTP transferase domain-containing protein [Clostridiales bacterium]
MTAALIITAGRTRSKTRFMPLKAIGGITAVQRLILVFRQAGIERIVLVTGVSAPDGGMEEAIPEDGVLSESVKVEKLVSTLNVVCLRNEGAGAEMLDSVKIGLSYLTGKCVRAMVTHVDVPFLTVRDVELLLAANCIRTGPEEKREGIPAEAVPSEVAALSYKGRAGHPLLISAKLFPRVLDYTGEGGLAGALKSFGIGCRYIEAEDEGPVTDIQRAEDYAGLLVRCAPCGLHPEIDVYLAKEKRFFGPGEYFLLSLIAETESVRLACRQMGISYSKAWRTLEAIQGELGGAIVEKRRGGVSKGGTKLTEQGARLVSWYGEYTGLCRGQAKSAFDMLS